MTRPAIPAVLRTLAEFVAVAAIVGLLVAGPALLREAAGADERRSPVDVSEAVDGLAF